MPSYSFKRQFVLPILSGRKIQTMRNPRKRETRVGETLSLFHGPRFKPERIGWATAASVYRVTLLLDKGGVRLPYCADIRSEFDLNNFAWQDGFDSWDELRAFWRETHGDLPDWSGILIRWKDFRPADALKTGG